MQRRELLVRLGGVLVAAPFILEATGCSDDDSGDDGNDNFTMTSSTNSGHNHRLTVQCTDLDDSSVEYFSSSDSGHSHRVTLTLNQLQEIAAGNSVTATLEEASGHTHTVSI